MPHEWQTGLFECKEAGPGCAHGFDVNSITWGSTRYRLQHRDDVEMKGYDEVNGPCLGCSVIGIIPGMPCLMQMLQRRRLRKQLDIQGNFGVDCLTSFFCHCCGLVQEDLEAGKWQQRRGVYADEMGADEEPRGEAGMRYMYESNAEA
ncbi:MAG: hypothetical protein M1828_001382 [Chrysothrix sp. TS-e1954]|nr:MAG: hypothetical protein M1828_001382 [Chrysothrix sp. TS-e1954]